MQERGKNIQQPELSCVVLSIPDNRLETGEGETGQRLMRKGSFPQDDAAVAKVYSFAKTVSMNPR